MADYFLDDAANGTNDGAAWATCYNTWAQVAAAGILTAANRLFVGADANITDPGAALTITGPTSGAPAVIISSTVGSVSYSVGTGKQVDTDSGAYAITFDGSFALYGLKCSSGAGISLASDSNEIIYTVGCSFAVGANGNIGLSANNARWISVNDIIDLTADGTTNRSGHVIGSASYGRIEMHGVTFVNAGYRTGSVFNAAAYQLVSGADFSGFTNGTACEIFGDGIADMSNCLTAATWAPSVTATWQGISVTATNCGPADAPTYVYKTDIYGTVVSSTSVYRTGGATVETVACSWKVDTTASASEGTPMWTPWMYGTLSGSPPGSKTFTVYIANNTADLTDAEAWIEVEYLGTSDEANTTLATDHRTITTTAANQTDDPDAGNLWTGTTLTYKQTLVPTGTVTVNEDGLYRVRVAIAKASATVYIDPKPVVS